MPTYDYRCQACGHEYELFQSITADPLKKCPACKKSKAKRLIGTGAGLIFKGSGFYITDYRDKSYSDQAKADTASPSSEGKSADAKSGDGKSVDSKATDGKKTEASPPAATKSDTSGKSPATVPAKPAKGKSSKTR